MTLHGFSMRVEVVRGWSPASPVYTVTRAAGGVVHEIDGEPAADWYRRFFTLDGELAPMPAAANRFPLIVEGPRPERQGLYRSMRRFDDPAGTVTFLGDVETGDHVRLGMGNDRSLLRTAARLTAGPEPEAAILFSCMGREAVLGDRAGDEGAAIRDALGGVPLGLLHLRGDRPDAAGETSPSTTSRPSWCSFARWAHERRSARARQRDPAQPARGDRRRAYEAQMAQLHAEKELAQVTLASIGDGVIRTDAQGSSTTSTRWPSG